MASLGINIRDNIDPKIVGKISRALAAAKDMTVRVGLPDSDTTEGSPLTHAQIGIINEFGTADGRIPARPFMQTGIELSKKAAAAMMGKAMLSLKEDVAPAAFKRACVKVLDRVGAYVAGQVKKVITAHTFAPNAASTVAAKGSSRPLIDTGAMRQAITWLVKS